MSGWAWTCWEAARVDDASHEAVTLDARTAQAAAEQYGARYRVQELVLARHVVIRGPAGVTLWHVRAVSTPRGWQVEARPCGAM